MILWSGLRAAADEQANKDPTTVYNSAGVATGCRKTSNCSNGYAICASAPIHLATAGPAGHRTDHRVHHRNTCEKLIFRVLGVAYACGARAPALAFRHYGESEHCTL